MSGPAGWLVTWFPPASERGATAGMKPILCTLSNMNGG